MVVLSRVFFSLILLFFLNGCAKTTYLYHQSLGQLKIFTKSRSNESMLKNVRVEDKIKNKIQYIQTLKKYFYNYWEKRETNIYNRVTLLEQKAVTYLVITSDFNVIKADKECFPFMGCFPYLGFFNLEHAKNFAKNKEAEGKYSHVRPVYAYSTLGYFDDPILSSFFVYNKFDLTELVFHELFHTIYFYKNKVQLNENLANYFGKQMAIEYFKQKNWDYKDVFEKEKKSGLVRKKLVDLTKKYQKTLTEQKPQSRQEADGLLNQFLESQLRPEMKKYCGEIDSTYCFPLKRKWNNASLAAYLTYENDSDRIALKVKKEGWTLKQFFSYIEQVTEKHSDEPSKLEEHLFKL